jgi:hypothetical protein
MATAFLGKKTQHCPKSIIKNTSGVDAIRRSPWTIFYSTIADAFKLEGRLPKSSKKIISYLENVTYPLLRNSSSFNLKPFHRSIHTSNSVLTKKSMIHVSPHQDISNPEEIFKDLNIKLENY